MICLQNERTQIRALQMKKISSMSHSKMLLKKTGPRGLPKVEMVEGERRIRDRRKMINTALVARSGIRKAQTLLRLQTCVGFQPRR